MRRFCDALDTGGGHILVALFLVLIGVALLIYGHGYGEQIAAGALGSLWTVIRITGRPPDPPPRVEPIDRNLIGN